jgi:hypothetical protein
MSDEARGLYRFRFSSYCEVSGMFTATAAEVAAMVGKNADFGEADGKHSHVAGLITADQFTLVTDDISFVAKFDEYGCRSGHSPKCAIEEWNEGHPSVNE